MPVCSTSGWLTPVVAAVTFLQSSVVFFGSAFDVLMLKWFDCLPENKETCWSLFSLPLNHHPDTSFFYCLLCFLFGLKKIIILMCSSAVMQITRGIPPVRLFFHFWLICERWCDSCTMTQIMVKQVTPASPWHGDINVATGAATSRSHWGFVAQCWCCWESAFAVLWCEQDWNEDTVSSFHRRHWIIRQLMLWETETSLHCTIDLRVKLLCFPVPT